MEASQRATVHGPTFIRLLARLGDADVPPPRHALTDRLSHWLDWTHAVALATALDASPATPTDFDEQAPAGIAAGEFARVRGALTEAIAADPAFTASADESAQTPEYAFFRQRYLAMQQRMEADIGHLRDRLRAMLSSTGTDMARLAAIDAVMDRTLGRQERVLMSTAATVLGTHFERLRQSEADDWLTTLRNDMRGVLLAELDVRLQPAQGLLAALTHQPN